MMTLNKVILCLFFGLFLGLEGHAAGGPKRKNAPPDTVEKVDLRLYQGKWFEVARLPNRFQKDCFNSTAEYSLRPDGKINVINRCKNLKGQYKETAGTAWSTNPPNNSKLEVRFFWPFSGDYWVLALDENYEWVIVGGPDYKYLWILSRKIPIEAELLQTLLNTAAQKGYDTSKLIFDPNIKLR